MEPMEDIRKQQLERGANQGSAGPGWVQGAKEKWGGNSKSSVQVGLTAAEQARERGLQRPLVPTEGVCHSGKDDQSEWDRWQFHAG